MWPVPSVGQVAWCCFPYNGHITAQRHPCLILHVISAAQHQPWVIVAGGTSAHKNGQWLRTIGDTDFLLQGEELKHAGLQNPTLFRFEGPTFDAAGQFTGGTLLGLPWSTHYFVAVGTPPAPVIGSVDFQRAATRDNFRRAAKAANLPALIEREYRRCLQLV